MNISNIKIGANSYTIKDTTARSTAGDADTKATQALLDASSADTKATNANTKIDGATVTGTYTSATETLEISLTLGVVSGNGGE